MGQIISVRKLGCAVALPLFKKAPPIRAHLPFFLEKPLATAQGAEVEEWLYGQTPMVFEAMNESHLPYAILSSSQKIRSSRHSNVHPKTA